MPTQTRNPTSDISESGTWSGASAGSRFTVVDDHPDSGGTDQLTHGATAGDLQFGFTAFDVAAGSTDISVQVLYYDQKNGNPACNIAARLRIGSTPTTHDASSHNPTNGVITLRTDNFTVNPKSGVAWTVDDVNGVGANGLVGFGWVSTDAVPSILLASILLQVTYASPPEPRSLIGPGPKRPRALQINTRSWQARDLMAWWPMAFGVGSQLRDLGPHGRHGTLNNFTQEAAWATLDDGYALDFAGDNDYVIVPSWPVASVTVAAWIFSDATAIQDNIVQNSSDSITLRFRHVDVGPAFIVLTAGGYNVAHGSTILSVGRWYHLCGTFDGTTTRLYVDGVQVAQVSTFSGTPVAFTNWHLGYNASLSAWPFNGLMADVRIYSRALSAAEGYGLYAPQTRWELYEKERWFPHISSGGPPEGVTLTAESGIYTFTGTAAGLRADRKLPSESGAYNLLGMAAGLSAGRRMAAESGVYLIVGDDASFHRTYVLGADGGVYQIVGSDASLRADRALPAESGVYSLLGMDAGLSVGRTLMAESGTYLIVGEAAGLLAHRLLVADGGVYLISGQDAALLVSGAGDKVLVAESGVYLLAGPDAALLAGRVVQVESGLYTLIDSIAVPRANRVLAAATGDYFVSGDAAALLRGAVLQAESGVYGLVGDDVSFLVDRRLIASSGSYLVVGFDAALVYSGAEEEETIISVYIPTFRRRRR